MNVFKRNSVHMAVLAGLGALGVAGTASAVHVNPDGLGEVLIYPYYTVRSAATSIASGQYNTYLSVTNSTASYKAVKVRIMEGKNSREVLDFNLFLSPFDVWTASIEPISSTASAGARIVTNDGSCTWGNIKATGATGVPFSNLAYTAPTDNGGATLDRTNEGYVEIMEMGDITNAALQTAVNHNASTGVALCSSTTLSVADGLGLTGYLSAPSGGLFGGATLINTATGVDYAYDAIALDNWDATVGGLGSASTSLTPSIASGSVLTSDVFTGGALQSATWLTGINAVSAAIMRSNVMNEYVLDAETVSTTDWVVTFPTKRFYVGVGAGNAAAPTAAGRLFNSNFGASGSCDPIEVALRDREERIDTTVSSGFSPAVGPTGFSICWEANVVTFSHATFTSGTATPVLGSTNSAGFVVPAAFENGWLNMAFDTTSTTPALQPAAGFTHYGLPVVGFMVQDFTNSTIVTGTGAAAGAVHGGQFVHKYLRDIR
ncbi:MAG: hypothetical protein A2Z65_07715 [Gallionellales bacterium RIFCSPLOWO2_02_58_13]|nr:MAG: hypothetical protein A2Z65_07715 [Gallionellales bacterium RIFCSPLOWO2_02_58_13]